MYSEHKTNPLASFAKVATVGKWGLSAEQLGRGAGGTVMKGMHLETGQLVAVKKLSLEASSQEAYALIRKELDLLRLLGPHPNILQLIDAKQTANNLYIVMELMETGSISTILRQNGVFPEVLCANIIGQVFRGLKYLHDRSILHRDVKGGNILVSTQRGSVKLGDFGVSMVAREAQDPGTGKKDQSTFAGSPYWMAPEVVCMDPPQATSDIWSAGCTVCEMFAGRAPYADLNPLSAMFHVVQDSEPPLPEFASPHLKNFLKLVLQKKPRKRPTAEQLLHHTWVTRGEQNFTRLGLSFQNDFPTLIAVSRDTVDANVEDEEQALIADVKKCAAQIVLATERSELEALTLRLHTLVTCPHDPPLDEYDDIRELLSETDTEASPLLPHIPSPTWLSKVCGPAAPGLLTALVQRSPVDALCVVEACQVNADSGVVGLLSVLERFTAVSPEASVKVSALLTALQARDVLDFPTSGELDQANVAAPLLQNLLRFWTTSQRNKRSVSLGSAALLRHLHRCGALLCAQNVSSACGSQVSISCLVAVEMLHNVLRHHNAADSERDTESQATTNEGSHVFRQKASRSGGMFSSVSASEIDIDALGSSDMYSPNTSRCIQIQNDSSQRISEKLLACVHNVGFSLELPLERRAAITRSARLLKQAALSEENQLTAMRALYEFTVAGDRLPAAVRKAVCSDILSFVGTCCSQVLVEYALSTLCYILLPEGGLQEIGADVPSDSDELQQSAPCITASDDAPDLYAPGMEPTAELFTVLLARHSDIVVRRYVLPLLVEACIANMHLAVRHEAADFLARIIRTASFETARVGLLAMIKWSIEVKEANALLESSGVAVAAAQRLGAAAVQGTNELEMEVQRVPAVEGVFCPVLTVGGLTADRLCVPTIGELLIECAQQCPCVAGQLCSMDIIIDFMARLLFGQTPPPLPTLKACLTLYLLSKAPRKYAAHPTFFARIQSLTAHSGTGVAPLAQTLLDCLLDCGGFGL